MPYNLFAPVSDCFNLRIYLPQRLLTPSNTGSFGVDDYCELGSRFKAQHIKTMVWWTAYKVGKLTANRDADRTFGNQLL